MNHSLADLPASLVRLRELTEAAGRTDAIEITVGGTVETADDVAAYADAGVTRIIVQPWPNSRGAIEGMRRFAREVLDTAGSRV
jgi:phosphoribosylformimino-5-aminoimidazole carboxamide ribonucleotide (ProFAR) isomerase